MPTTVWPTAAPTDAIVPSTGAVSTVPSSVRWALSTALCAWATCVWAWRSSAGSTDGEAAGAPSTYAALRTDIPAKGTPGGVMVAEGVGVGLDGDGFGLGFVEGVGEGEGRGSDCSRGWVRSRPVGWPAGPPSPW